MIEKTQGMQISEEQLKKTVGKKGNYMRVISI